jgi:hypothetical protein
MERTITEVTRDPYERVFAKVNRDTGEVMRLQPMPLLAKYTVAYNTPRKKGQIFTCRAESEANAVAQAEENFARIDAGIHIRDVNKQGAST